MTKNELIERGNMLAEKFSEEHLKDALKGALFLDDNEERLALQWALKQKTGTTNGYAFTKEQEKELKTRLVV